MGNDAALLAGLRLALDFVDVAAEARLEAVRFAFLQISEIQSHEFAAPVVLLPVAVRSLAEPGGFPVIEIALLSALSLG